MEAHDPRHCLRGDSSGPSELMCKRKYVLPMFSSRVSGTHCNTALQAAHGSDEELLEMWLDLGLGLGMADMLWC